MVRILPPGRHRRHQRRLHRRRARAGHQQDVVLGGGAEHRAQLGLQPADHAGVVLVAVADVVVDQRRLHPGRGHHRPRVEQRVAGGVLLGQQAFDQGQRVGGRATGASALHRRAGPARRRRRAAASRRAGASRPSRRPARPRPVTSTASTSPRRAASATPSVSDGSGKRVQAVEQRRRHHEQAGADRLVVGQLLADAGDPQARRAARVRQRHLGGVVDVEHPRQLAIDAQHRASVGRRQAGEALDQRRGGDLIGHQQQGRLGDEARGRPAPTARWGDPSRGCRRSRSRRAGVATGSAARQLFQPAPHQRPLPAHGDAHPPDAARGARTRSVRSEQRHPAHGRQAVGHVRVGHRAAAPGGQDQRLPKHRRQTIPQPARPAARMTRRSAAQPLRPRGVTARWLP